MDRAEEPDGAVAVADFPDCRRSIGAADKGECGGQNGEAAARKHAGSPCWSDDPTIEGKLGLSDQKQKRHNRLWRFTESLADS